MSNVFKLPSCYNGLPVNRVNLGKDEVGQCYGVSGDTIMEWVAAGKFPEPEERAPSLMMNSFYINKKQRITCKKGKPYWKLKTILQNEKRACRES